MLLLTSFVFPDFADPSVWISLLTLTFLEIVLGIDNIIFITIASNRLSISEQPKARFIGMMLAMIFRIILLFGISTIIAMQEPLLSFDLSWFKGGFSGQSLILALGGVFLLYKATNEIHHKLDGENSHDNPNSSVKKSTLQQVIIQIALINVVFSFDSILTAVGLTDNLFIMIFSVITSVGIMLVFAGPVSKFVNDHPSIQILGLSFLILIGFMLMTEAAHLAHLQVFGSEIGTIPKGYLYFAIFFSLVVEFLNMRVKKKQKPIQLHGLGEDAKKEGLID
jgi:predicted tellurium resistance membrane protein TerC